jgi:alanyl-tRNA synthetase
MNTSHELRNAFLNYFKKNGHKAVPSDSLIPSGDPTLLFTSAGMVQFKKHFLGQSKDTFTRAASCQKCFRTSDIERVGYTGRHLTFFEMLGNFSFGDYFKKDAVFWAWDFLTKEVGLDPKKLYPTVYKEDDEAFELWKKIGVPESKIIRLGEDSNFWNMGPTGPCGPCSEILMDMGEHISCGKPSCGPGCDCDRYLEIWNLVFTQFDRQANGELRNLPRKNIDTGMGLERLTAAAAMKSSIFETDLFEPLVKYTAQALDVKVEGNESALRMIADHTRGTTFLISDGILPSNEGRGYVLRRILRRALRKVKTLGVSEPFLYKLSALVADNMKHDYPELDSRRENIASIIKMEEENFLSTLETGTVHLEDLLKKYTSNKTIPGAEVFKLYDTYGFPPELTKEIASEKGISIDEEGFKLEQKKAQEKSRAAWSGSGEKDITLYSTIHKEAGDTVFVGYKEDKVSTKIAAVIKNGKSVEKLAAGEEGEIVIATSPFYAESGGQVGDTGHIKSDSVNAEVLDTKKPVDGLFVLKVKVIKGELAVKSTVEASVDTERRKSITRHHTATHLLHRALRQILGTHVTQAGSLVTPDNLRFDFTHFHGLKQEEILAVEEIVNSAVRENMEVCTDVMNVDEARKTGAMALFGEKYSDKVRVVSVLGNKESEAFSRELCGGIHVNRTGDIGFFKIISESSIASGTRRIEAVGGRAAEKYINDMLFALNETAAKLKGGVSEIPAKLDRLLAGQKELEKEIRKLKLDLAGGQANAGGPSGPNVVTREIDGEKVLLSRTTGLDANSLRDLSDSLKNKLGSGIVFLINIDEDKFSFVTSLTQDAVKRGYSAGKIAKVFASIAGGSGGGRPELAQGGGKDVSKLEQVLADLSKFIIKG